MRQQSKWTGKVKTDLVVREYPMRLQWGYHMIWGEPKFLDISPLAALTGVYDGWIKQSARKLRMGLIQYDELAIIREKIAKNINKYDSRKGCIETYLFRLVWWSARDVRARCHRTQVDHPFRLFERKREFRGHYDVRIDRLKDLVDADGPGAFHAAAELEEIRKAFGESQSPEDAILQAEIAEAVVKAVKSLPKREKKILLARMWWITGEKHGKKDKTLEEISQQMGISRERVNQLQRRAVSLLRIKLEPFWREYRAA